MDFDWGHARAFLATAQHGSFSSAARALGTTQPTVGRQVAALERELGVTLFERVGTTLELTVAGLDLAEHVRAMSDAATRVIFAATGQQSSIEGSVCITSSDVIAAHLLPRIVLGLRRDYPGIELELVATIQTRDLLRREADIAIRNHASSQPDLVTKKIRDARARMYASPAYVKRSKISSAKDLARAEIFAFDRTDVMIDGFKKLGIPVERRQFPVVTSNHLVQWELCKRGVGICMMMEEIGDAEPLVRRVLPDLPAVPIPIWLVCHRELRTSRRIRVVFDRLVEELAKVRRRAILSG